MLAACGGGGVPSTATGLSAIPWQVQAPARVEMTADQAVTEINAVQRQITAVDTTDLLGLVDTGGSVRTPINCLGMQILLAFRTRLLSEVLARIWDTMQWSSSPKGPTTGCSSGNPGLSFVLDHFPSNEDRRNMRKIEEILKNQVFVN